MGVIEVWRSYGIVQKTLLLLVLLVFYTNFNRNYQNGKKTIPNRMVFLPFGLEILLLHVVINPFMKAGFGHIGRVTSLVKHVYGKSFGSRLLWKQVFNVQDPEIIKHILATNFSNYEKGETFTHALEPFLGRGIFNSDGEAWRNQRNIAKGHFQRDDIKQMVNTFLKHSNHFLEILRIHATNQPEKTLDFQDLFLRFTLDSAGEILMGYDFESQTKESEFARSFEYLQRISVYRLRNPLWKLTAWMSQNTYQKHVDVCHGLVNKLVEKCLHDPLLEQREDLLADLVKSKDETGHSHSIPYLRDMCLNFLLAGRDTTAALLTWSVYLISSHPEVEKKLVQEIDQVLGRDQPNPENIKELRYMKQVLNEVLRLYPSVPNNVRSAKEDDYLPDGSYVPKGSIFFFSMFIVARILWT